MQIAPKNVFRYFGDGAQWNAGLGEIVYKKLGWRKAAIIMDDYSFGWTSAAGIIADFCAVGGKITKRVFPPLNTTDYSSFVRQLPPPEPGRRLLLGRRRDRHRRGLKAFEQAYGKLDPKQYIGNLFFWFLGATRSWLRSSSARTSAASGIAPGPEDAAGEAVPRRHEEVLPEAPGGGLLRRSTTTAREGAGRRA